MPAFLGAKNTVSSKDGNVLMGILRDPEKADFDGSKTISFSEAIVLGVRCLLIILQVDLMLE